MSASTPIRYPECVDQRHGCKVGWLYYETKEEAEAAAVVAEADARRYAAQGYDFGFQVPGSIMRMPPSSEKAGLYEVCIP